MSIPIISVDSKWLKFISGFEPELEFILSVQTVLIYREPTPGIAWGLKMLNKGILLGLVLLGSSMSVNAAEITIYFKEGKPTQKEFVLAAKKAYYRRNYESSAISEDKVTGVYKKVISMEMVLTDSGVIIRNTDPAGYKEKKIRGYLRNLERDLVYELAEFML